MTAASKQVYQLGVIDIPVRYCFNPTSETSVELTTGKILSKVNADGVGKGSRTLINLIQLKLKRSQMEMGRYHTLPLFTCVPEHKAPEMSILSPMPEERPTRGACSPFLQKKGSQCECAEIHHPTVQSNCRVAPQPSVMALGNHEFITLTGNVINFSPVY